MIFILQHFLIPLQNGYHKIKKKPVFHNLHRSFPDYPFQHFDISKIFQILFMMNDISSNYKDLETVDYIRISSTLFEFFLQLPVQDLVALI